MRSWKVGASFVSCWSWLSVQPLVRDHNESMIAFSVGLGRIAASGATDFTGVVMGANPDEVAAARRVLSSYR